MFGFKKGMAQLDGRDRAWAKEISQKTCAEEAVNAAKKDSPSRVDFILKNYRKHLAEQTWDIIQAAVDNNSGRVMQMLADKYSGLFFRNIWPDGNTKDLNNLLQAASEKGSFRTWLPV